MFNLYDRYNFTFVTIRLGEKKSHFGRKIPTFVELLNNYVINLLCVIMIHVNKNKIHTEC